MQRFVAMAVLWFAMTWFAWEIVASIVDGPRAIGPIVATSVAALVVATVRGRVVGSTGRAVPSTPSLEPGFRPAE